MTGHLLIKEQETRNKEQKNYKLQNSKNNKKDYFEDRVNQYIRHKFFLKSWGILEFSDMRKFGKIVLGSTEEINNLKEIKSLGIDALDPKLTFKKFQEILNKKPKSKIGIILMDQNIISGIGNIYRSEILYYAGILPERIVETISLLDLKKVYAETKKVLKKAVKMRGTSDSDYRDTSGAPGSFQKVLKVYNRERQNCKKCGRIIKRETLGQRSVFVCKKCQK
jgi:formamidopyrimidine-DNA glycosylase